MSQEHQGIDCWGIVEVMGHQVYCGRISEQVIAGHSFVRVDIPSVDGAAEFTKLFGAGSIYAITPTTQEIATIRAAQAVHRPINVYDLPREWREKIQRPALPTPNTADEAYLGDDEPDDNFAPVDPGF